MNKKAFTLAEVLITLGIIGVVAALTIPTLMANHRKHVVETKLAKIYSVMNQAITMTNAEYGEASNWVIDCGLSSNISCTQDNVKDWFMSTIGKNLDVVKIENNPNDEKQILVYFKDGSILGVATFIRDMTYFINSDAITNGVGGKNVFLFRYNIDYPGNKQRVSDLFEPYAWAWNGTREQLVSGNSYSCDGQYRNYCTKLIQYDGWKISKDYPVKF